MDDNSTDPKKSGSSEDGKTPPQLFVVDPAHIDEILAMEVPAHPKTAFDEKTFKDLIARSFSITIEEKRDIVNSVAKFSQHQIDELFRILKEERVKFAELNSRHANRLNELDEKHAAEWQALDEQAKSAAEEGKSREDDEKKAEEIKKQLGL